MSKPFLFSCLFGNRSLRCSRSLFQTRFYLLHPCSRRQPLPTLLYLLHPCSRTSCILAVVASLTLASCSTVFSYLPIYTLEIQQGNIVDQDMVDQIRPGMNKRQVLYIMGSPMLVDAFHKNRWDYMYSDKPKDDEDRVQKKISLYFENDQIIGIQGDIRPSAVPVIKPSPETTVNVPKRDLDETLWDKITHLFDYDDQEDAAPKSTEDPENLKPETDADKTQL